MNDTTIASFRDMFKLTMLASLLLIVVTVSSCNIQQDYVSADKATFDAIGPEYLRYVYGDATLNEDEKKRRLRTVETWKERLKAVEKP